MQAREKLPSAGVAHLCIMRIPFRGKLPYNEWENIQGENRNMSIIFFDIDGTVMDLDGTIPPSAVTAVRRLRQAGHHCVINTGRPRLAMDPQLMDMDFDGLVCSCGQYIQLDGKIIRHVGFDRETSRKILEIGRRCRVDMYFEEAERIWCDTPHGVVNRELRGAIARLEARGVRVGQPDGDPDFHFDKVCVLTAPDSLREEFLAEVAPMCQVIDRGNMLELPVRGYSKASGCLAVAQALGEDLADCYAIGDSANDLEMLQCVGHPLVMGNAPARVQAVAEYVTGTPAEDGLYHAMVHAGLLAE